MIRSNIWSACNSIIILFVYVEVVACDYLFKFLTQISFDWVRLIDMKRTGLQLQCIQFQFGINFVLHVSGIMVYCVNQELYVLMY